MWCGVRINLLLLNVAKEMAVDFKRTSTKLNTISILGQEVEVVQGYRYLGVHLDNSYLISCVCDVR